MTDMTDMDAFRAETIPKSAIDKMEETTFKSLQPISKLQGFQWTPPMKKVFRFLPIENPPTEYPIRFLPYRPGLITVTEITNKFVLTGPMSGCYLSIFKLNGKKYLAHLGTGDVGFERENEAMKEAWKHAVNETPFKDAVEYCWKPSTDLKDHPVVKKGWDKELTGEDILRFFYAGAVRGSGEQIKKYSIVFGKCEDILNDDELPPQPTSCFMRIRSKLKGPDFDNRKGVELIMDRHFSQMILQDAPAESRPPNWQE